jgi:hypothetical protein
MGSGCIDPHIVNLDTRWSWAVSFMHWLLHPQPHPPIPICSYWELNPNCIACSLVTKPTELTWVPLTVASDSNNWQTITLLQQGHEFQSDRKDCEWVHNHLMNMKMATNLGKHLTTHFHLVASVNKEWSYTSTLPYTFMVWHLIKH